MQFKINICTKTVFVFAVVSKLVDKGYQPHLEDFLLRINFNNYYKDS